MITMKVSKKDVDFLCEFLGYGRKDAKTIFIGLEEAGGDEDRLKVRLGLNSRDKEILDCRDFHLNYLNTDISQYKLHNSDPEYKVKLQRVWMYMSYFMLRMDGKNPDEIKKNNSKLLRYYQNNLLGSSNFEGETLLTDLFPVPCASIKSWPDNKISKSEKLFPEFKNKKEYQDYVLPQRKKLFLKLLNSYEFEANTIICYGKSKWDDYKEFFSDFEVKWEPLDLSKPTYKGQMNDDVTIYLLPFLGNGQVSYKFIDELVNYINREN